MALLISSSGRGSRFCATRLCFIALALAACFLGIIDGQAQEAEPVVITEFLADNPGPLRDLDGDKSDWIEIYNAGTNTVNLAGWHLTDNPANLVKWTFPVMSLGPGRFLTVFASGKNRAVGGSELHANFELTKEGGYLALVRADGLSIAHEFAPYPPQAEGISYGILLNTVSTSFLAPDNQLVWQVPRSAVDFASNWMTLDYEDTNWVAGQIGLGFDGGQISGGVAVGTTNIARGKTATQSSQFSSSGPGLAIDGLGSTYAQTAAGQNLPATWELNLGSTYPIERVVISNRQDGYQSRLRDITVQILDLSGQSINFQSALLNPENILGGGSTNGPASLALNLTNLTGSVVYGGRVRIIRTPDPDLSGSGGLGDSNEVDLLSLAEVEVFASPAPQSFRSMLITDLESDLRGNNASLLLRIPFTFDIETMSTPDLLTLRMRYDDGFVAYLNGVEVARRNAPALPTWNSSASLEHPDLQAAQFEDIDITPYISYLTIGDNVLAIQALNRSKEDDDLLIMPELVGTTLQAISTHYFPFPSPGTNNSAAYLGYVADTKFSVDRGFYEAPFSLAITSATPNVIIRYTTNGSEPTLTNGVTYSGPITISRTTVLRAAAFKPGYRPSNVDTHTYVFVNDVVQQTYQVTTNAGFPSMWDTNSADYGMDPDVIGPGDLYGGKYAATIKADLKSVPTLSIVMKQQDLFGTNGIYVQSTKRGLQWERPNSVELLCPDGTEGFQVNSGIRLQGGAFRGHSLTLKHSFHLVFKDIYGPGKLHYPLFGTNANTAFDDLTLRANANDSWTRSTSRGNSVYLRDSFARHTLLEHGGVAVHEQFVHLYLNGFYWGMYDLVERPDAGFSSAYFGGEKDNWDSINNDTASNGDLNAWNMLRRLCTNDLRSDAAYQFVQGNNPDGTRNPTYTNYLDVENMIDYMIVHLYGGNADWPHHNWWVARERTTNSTGFKFYLWDLEQTLALSSASALNVDRTMVSNSVAIPYAGCRSNAEFRVLFGDHVHQFFFNGGPLFVDPTNPQWDPTHPERNRPAEQFNRLAESIFHPIVAESARWGDQLATVPYTRDVHWAVERTNLLRNYFPYRSAIVLQQFRNAGLYPTVEAPLLSHLGGSVPAGFYLYIENTNAAGGTIYYTLDGSDPRLRGGSVSPQAVGYAGALLINSSVEVKARVLLGSNWSALVKAVFYTPQDFTKLMISEIMYHPPRFGAVDGDEVEFLELKNTGLEPLNLTGLSFTQGITFSFTNGTILAPGGFFVLAANRAQFTAKYPSVQVGGVYTGKLDNGGETLRIVHPSGATVLSVTYGDDWPWPLTPDGYGFSLVPLNPNANPEPDEPANWRASALSGGSPGADDPPVSIPAIVINEILTASTGTEPDVIELFNPTANPADVGGWFLTDDPAAPQKYRIPTGTVIAPNGYLTFDERQFNTPPGGLNSFALHADGDEVYLFSGNSNGELTGYNHGFRFGAADAGVTFGRYVNSLGQEELVAQSVPTLGTSNAGPKVGPIVINEIMYHPGLDGDEYIELKNITSEPVPLFDAQFPTNTWKLTGLGFTMPTNITIAPDGLLLLVATNPAAFQLKYLVPPTVPILGPWPGVLQDSGERLELQHPKSPGPSGGVPYVVIDAVRYNDKAPWPPAADGGGPALLRRDAGAYGNDPANWSVAWPTPGKHPSGAPPTIAIQPTNQSSIAYQDYTLTVEASGPPPLFFQWYFNGSMMSGATNFTLQLTNLQPSHGGSYRLVIYNESGATKSDSFVLSVLIPVSIVTHPNTQSARFGSAVSFSVSTTGSLPVSYQWRYNGTDIPEATNRVLTLTNVTVEQEGLYSVALADGIRALVSDAAGLTVTIGPVLRRSPQSQTVPVGSTVDFQTTATGKPMPLTFRWVKDRIGVPVASMVLHDTNCTLTLPNVALINGGAYTVSVTNACDGFPNFAVSGNAYLTVVVPPTNRLADPGSNVTFSVTARAGTSTSKLAYQWLFRGTNLLNATNASLVLTNVQADQQGIYTVLVYNPAGTPTGFSAELAFANPDCDGDGLPDVWELAHGLTPRDAGDALLDADKDGLSNAQEYLAGTDPQDPLSALRIESIAPSADAGAIWLQFLALSNKTYSLLRMESIENTNWRPIAHFLAAPTNRNCRVTDSISTNQVGTYYRLVTPLSP